jgi:hypothetical protein
LSHMTQVNVTRAKRGDTACPSLARHRQPCRCATTGSAAASVRPGRIRFRNLGHQPLVCAHWPVAEAQMARDGCDLPPWCALSRGEPNTVEWPTSGPLGKPGTLGGLDGCTGQRFSRQSSAGRCQSNGRNLAEWPCGGRSPGKAGHSTNPAALSICMSCTVAWASITLDKYPRSSDPTACPCAYPTA